MGDFVLIDGDSVIFMPAFGVAVVVVQPGTLRGSGPATINGKKICVDGDESKVSVPGCMYTAPPYVIPGTGTLKIKQLAPNQLAKKTRTGGKAVLLKGGNFQAVFEVQQPAKMPNPPAPPTPDSMTQYPGSGMFITTNIKTRGT